MKTTVITMLAAAVLVCGCSRAPQERRQAPASASAPASAPASRPALTVEQARARASELAKAKGQTVAPELWEVRMDPTKGGDRWVVYFKSGNQTVTVVRLLPDGQDPKVVITPPK